MKTTIAHTKKENRLIEKGRREALKDLGGIFQKLGLTVAWKAPK